MNDFFNDFDDGQTNENAEGVSVEKKEDKPTPSRGGNGGGRSYAEEVFSKKIEARSRTYFIDVKQSMYGKFVKISERNSRKKSTIMVDAENIDEFIEALTAARENMN